MRKASLGRRLNTLADRIVNTLADRLARDTAGGAACANRTGEMAEELLQASWKRDEKEGVTNDHVEQSPIASV